MYCSTELSLSVDMLKEKQTQAGTMLVYRGNVVVYILSTVKTENTYNMTQNNCRNSV